MGQFGVATGPESKPIPSISATPWRLSWGVQFVDRSAAFHATRSAQKPNGQRRVTAIGHSPQKRLSS